MQEKRNGSKLPPKNQKPSDEQVEENSEDSFPASDPPSFNPGTAGPPSSEKPTDSPNKNKK